LSALSLSTSCLFAVTSDYFLEDIVQMLDFTPPPSEKKRKSGRDDDDAVDAEDKDDKEVKSDTLVTVGLAQ